MDIKNNPVTNTAKTAVSLTVYFLCLMAAMEASGYLYTRYAPDVKWKSKKLYWAANAKAKAAKRQVVDFAKKITTRS